MNDKTETIAIADLMSQSGVAFGTSGARGLADAIGQRAVDEYLKQTPALETYRHQLEDVIRRGAHTRGRGCCVPIPGATGVPPASSVSR